MALTLDATLQTAQDGIDHHPIVEVVSSRLTAAIPFTGITLSSGDVEQARPKMIPHSSGRMLALHARAATDGDFDYVDFYYTDIDRTFWTKVSYFFSSAYYKDFDVALTEMSDGNILLAYAYYSAGWKVSTAIVDATGNIQTAWGTRFTHVDNLTGLDVALLSDNSYFMVYSDDDPPNYTIFRRTSSDGITWSNATAFSDGYAATYIRKDPCIFVHSTGELYVLYACQTGITDSSEPIVNLAYFISTDDGSTWSSANLLTSITDFSLSPSSPSFVEKTNNELFVAYVESFWIYTMEDTATGNISGEYFGGPKCYVQGDKLYLSSMHYSSTKQVKSLSVIDIPTWTIESQFYNGSTPGFHSVFNDANIDFEEVVTSSYPYCAIKTYSTSSIFPTSNASDKMPIIQVFDMSLGTNPRTYYFGDNSYYGITANVIGVPQEALDYSYGAKLNATYIDSSGKLWISIGNSSGTTSKVWIGYIDIAEAADAQGKYQFNYLYASTEYASYSDDHTMTVPGDGYVYLCYKGSDIGITKDTSSELKQGSIVIFSATTGSFITRICIYNNPLFPFWGLRTVTVIDGVIWGGVDYTSGSGQADRRGLARIDNPISGNPSITYFQPSMTAEDNCYINGIVESSDGRLVMDGTNWPVMIFDPSTGSWSGWNSTNHPGIKSITEGIPDDDDMANRVQQLAYHAGTNAVFMPNGSGPYLTWYDALWGINIDGALQRMLYAPVTKETDDTLTLDTTSLLTTETQVDSGEIALDENDSIWAMWSTGEEDARRIKWENDYSNFYLQDDLISGSTLRIQHSVADLSRCEFTLGRGHLYDPTNSASILSQAMVMGRKITVKMGESVSGVDYWANQGVFLVTETRISYRRDNHPVLDVVCEDARTMWKDQREITTTAFADTATTAVFQNLASTIGGFAAEDFINPSLSHYHNLYAQWVDQNLYDIIQELCDHFGVFQRVDENGKFEIMEIDLDKVSDHEYTSLLPITSFTPDGKYASWVNRVIVMAESRNTFEVTYEYETLGRLNGTVGWWGHDKSKTVYFSNDKQQEAVNVKLNVIESTKNFEFFSLKGGGGEDISYVDPNRKYIVVDIEAPNLVGVFIGLSAAILGFGTAALTCGPPTGPPCGPYIFGLSVTANAMATLLGAVANYDIEVNGQPTGHERTSFQAQADDEDFQIQINRVITESFEDPLCYEPGHAQMVADREMAVISAQRRRITFSKPTHLQDEIGDVIIVPHPFSGLNVKVFVAELTRTMTIPTPGESDGDWSDEIVGWRIT